MAKLLYDEHVTQDHEVLCICTENKVPICFCFMAKFVVRGQNLFLSITDKTLGKILKLDCNKLF